MNGNCGGGEGSIAAPQKLLELANIVSTIVPPVTVVLDGRSICHRIHLNKHSDYGSFAASLHRMFAEMVDGGGENGDHRFRGGLDLSNAVPGHLVAYEDFEDDLLLAGDLNWKDFVRVVKRIRIIPSKARQRKHNQCKNK